MNKNGVIFILVGILLFALFSTPYRQEPFENKTMDLATLAKQLPSLVSGASMEQAEKIHKQFHENIREERRKNKQIDINKK